MGKNCYKKPPFSLDLERRGDLTAQLVSALRRAIETGYYRAGDVLPPVRDLAALLGVSPCIAARAVVTIRDEGLVSPRPRIGSVVCSKDRPLWKGHVVIVVPPGQGNTFDNETYTVLRDSLTAAGYLVTPVTVAETRVGRFEDFALLDTVLRQQTDLVVQLHAQKAISLWLSKRGLPFVRLATDDCTVFPGCVGVFRFDYDLALPDFAAHCREAGVKSVLQLASHSHTDATEVLGREGISVSTLFAPRPLGGTGFAIGSWAAATFARHLAKGHGWLPDLILFRDDHLASGALLALAMAGVRIPEDVRVVTWMNRDYGPIFTKPLTRMEMDIAAAGAKLAECVLEYLGKGIFPEGVVVGPKYVRGATF